MCSAVGPGRRPPGDRKSSPRAWPKSAHPGPWRAAKARQHTPRRHELSLTEAPRPPKPPRSARQASAAAPLAARRSPARRSREESGSPAAAAAPAVHLARGPHVESDFSESCPWWAPCGSARSNPRMRSASADKTGRPSVREATGSRHPCTLCGLGGQQPCSPTSKTDGWTRHLPTARHAPAAAGSTASQAPRCRCNLR